jgi:hypothetical protein
MSAATARKIASLQELDGHRAQPWSLRCQPACLCHDWEGHDWEDSRPSRDLGPWREHPGPAPCRRRSPRDTARNDPANRPLPNQQTEIHQLPQSHLCLPLAHTLRSGRPALAGAQPPSRHGPIGVKRHHHDLRQHNAATMGAAWPRRCQSSRSQRGGSRPTLKVSQPQPPLDLMGELGGLGEPRRQTGRCRRHRRRRWPSRSMWWAILGSKVYRTADAIPGVTCAVGL